MNPRDDMARDSYVFMTRGERRERKRRKARYGMQVVGTSVKVLATIIPKAKRRRRRQHRR